MNFEKQLFNSMFENDVTFYFAASFSARRTGTVSEINLPRVRFYSYAPIALAERSSGLSALLSMGTTLPGATSFRFATNRS